MRRHGVGSDHVTDNALIMARSARAARREQANEIGLPQKNLQAVPDHVRSQRD